jgi:hypothetical protein
MAKLRTEMAEAIAEAIRMERMEVSLWI